MNPTLWFIPKAGISALLIAAISELGKRSSLLAALLASLPLISLLAIFWLFIETVTYRRLPNSLQASSGSSCRRWPSLSPCRSCCSAALAFTWL